jgi:hypothetical protein
MMLPTPGVRWTMPHSNATALQAAVTKLGERLEQLKDQEENERRQLAYDNATAERDKLAAELTDFYPAFTQKLAELCARVAANDREIEYINKHAPTKGR